MKRGLDWSIYEVFSLAKSAPSFYYCLLVFLLMIDEIGSLGIAFGDDS